MTKKIWFYLCIIEAAILSVIIVVFLWQSFSPITVEQANLTEYLDKDKSVDYLPQTGYIPDAETAKTIGSAIIDKMVGNSSFRPSGVDIEYDEENRLWKISKGYFYGFFTFGPGGVVVIEQDSGKIVNAYLTK